MKLFFHFAVVGFSNTYLIGPESGGDAILIDPGVMDIELLKLIEGNGYYIRNILVTHSHESHVKGLHTILKIYDAKIHGKAPMICDRITSVMESGKKYNLDGIEVEALDAKGHAADHLVYRIQNMLFTGDILAAGRLGSCESAVERVVMLTSIQDNLLPLPDNLLIFPGHGPPSTLKTERLFNPDLQTDQSRENILMDNGIVPEEEL